MDELKRYYDLLGLTSGANLNDLNKAYRRKIKQWHPDQFSNNPKLLKQANEKLKEINEAKGVLSHHIKYKSDNAASSEKSTTQHNAKENYHSEQPNAKKYKHCEQPRDRQQSTKSHNRSFNAYRLIFIIASMFIVVLVKYTIHDINKINNNRTNDITYHTPKTDIRKYYDPGNTPDKSYNRQQTSSSSNEDDVKEKAASEQAAIDKAARERWLTEQKAREQEEKLLAARERAEEKRAEKEQAEADEILIVAKKYYRGDGVKRDEAKAISFYKKAAKMGKMEAVEFLKVIGVKY